MKKHFAKIKTLLTAALFGAILSMAVDPQYAVTVFFVGSIAAAFFGLFIGLPKGALGNVPAATAGDYSGAYISLQDIGMPKWYDKLVASKGDQGLEFVGMVHAMNWCQTEKEDTKLVQHYEDDWIWDNFRVAAQAGGGLTATLTISSVSIYDGKFYPGVNDIIEFPNTDASGNPILAQVTAIGANTIDVKVANTAWTIPATTEGQELIVGTTWYADDTGQPASKRTTFNLYQNQFVINKQSVKMTGLAMTEELKWKNYELISGKNMGGVVSRTTGELDIRMMIGEQYTFLSGQTTDNLTGIAGLEGMFAGMRRASIQFPYVVWGLSAYDAMDKAQSQVYAGSIQGMLMGINLEQANRSVMSDYLKHTNVDYVTKSSNLELFGNAENSDALAMVIDFNYIKLTSKRRYAFKRFDSLINPKQYGATGYNYQGNFYTIPLKKNNVDPNNQMRVPTMQIIYRAKDGYDRRNEFFTTGSANVAKYGNTNDVDNRIMNGRSTMSARFFALSQWINGYQN